MATVEKVSIALTHDMAALVRQAVESGDYASSSEVVRDALREWKTKRELEAQRIETLRGLWREGLESGPGRFAGMDDLLAEARRRFDAQG
jgi:antitoxin ParD1/3/4